MLAAELLEAGEAFVQDVERGAVAEADAFVIAERNAGDGGEVANECAKVDPALRLETA